MKLFVLQKNHGIAVIVAESASIALEVLAKKEESELYLSRNTSVDDLKEVDLNVTERGIVAYFAE